MLCHILWKLISRGIEIPKVWTAQFKFYGRDHAVLRGRLFLRDTGSAWSTGIAGCSGLTVI